jgi:hypothetical protein
VQPKRVIQATLALLALTASPACQSNSGQAARSEAPPQPEAARPADLIRPASSTPAPPILERAVDTLKPGEFLWRPEASPDGPLLIVVSIPDQRAHVNRSSIADDQHFARNIAHPGLLAPLGPKAMKPQTLETPGKQEFVWEPARAQAGPRAFAESLYAALEPGATLHTTDLPISGASRTPPGFVVLSEHGSDGGG